eukprot:CAMPEP_0172450374 /NCGR_PEP_ID=MMETSP1065-20121228/8737_1 /TAXON_ID=265537 /ORGANISM="Amphiprora paludosa, Strain CCMP125" /LENGTH=489 /DNA_ID=CAMNT_0013202153 /DNA_START=96 /DNA_END=1565 /DNA_ORIENTATION=-
MDFGRPHVHQESIATRSQIRYIPLDQVQSDENATDADKALDRLVVHHANEAARKMLLGPKPEKEENETDSKSQNDIEASIRKWMDTSLYTQRSLPLQSTIQPGDLVVIQISFDNLNFIYAEKNAIFSNRNGHFHHNDFLGKPYGCQIRSRNNKGFGFCYLLKPTPELWIRSLNHRTQIVHELDQSQIIFQLQLRPNQVVVESGTGSAAMSHTFARTLAPAGHLYTFEFNPHRAVTAREEFNRHGLSHLVTVQNVDVCQSGFPGVSHASVDGVFLDLPEPWNAVGHAAYVLKPNARLASYSPCVEQTQRTVAALEAAGFHSMITMEYRLMEHYVDQVTHQSPPFHVKRPCMLDAKYNPTTQPLRANKKRKKRKDYKENDNETEPEESQTKEEEGDAVSSDVPMKEEETVTNSDDGKTRLTPSTDDEETEKKKPSQLMARPFGTMRGHTAFLTFATAGLLPQPKPSHFCNVASPMESAGDDVEETTKEGSS